MSKRHVGIHAHRLVDSPLEAKFAKRWREDNERGLLNQILTCGDVSDVSPRDEAVAATIIQWLGSNVGRSFVREVMKSEDS